MRKTRSRHTRLTVAAVRSSGTTRGNLVGNDLRSSAKCAAPTNLDAILALTNSWRGDLAVVRLARSQAQHFSCVAVRAQVHAQVQRTAPHPVTPLELRRSPGGPLLGRALLCVEQVAAVDVGPAPPALGSFCIDVSRSDIRLNIDG